MSRPSRDTLVSHCLLALFLAAVVARPSAHQGRTVGTAAGALLGVDFQAVTTDGQPITDLKSDEITLQVDGKTRALKSLQFVDLSGPPAAAAVKPAASLPAPFGTNAGGSTKGRQVYLVVENETLVAGREQATRDAIAQFLGRLTSDDHVALVTVPHGGVNVDLTSDFQLIRQTLPKIAGMYQSGEKAVDAACRARDTLNAIAGMLGGRAGSQTPVDLVLFSSKMSGFKTSGQINIRNMAGQEGSTACELRTDDFDKVKLAAAAAHTHMYIVQPEDGAYFNNSDNTDSPSAGLESLAGVTNGIKLSLGSAGGALNRIARETSGYYVATYEPDPSDRNGSMHSLSVKVSRSSVAVRSEPNLVIDKPAAAGAKPNAPSPKDMLMNTNVYGDLPIRTAAFVSRNSPDPKDPKVRVLAVTEAVDPAVKLQAASAALFDGAKRVAQWTADPSELAKWPLAAAFPVPAGISYRLRVATVDTTGRSGSADYTVNASLTALAQPGAAEGAASGVKLSGLVLGTGTPFKPQLQFTNEPTVTAYFELYGMAAGMGISALDVELAATETGPALAKFDPVPAATNEPDRFMFTAPIAIAALSPGDYVVRITIDIAGKGTARITRTLRKAGE